MKKTVNAILFFVVATLAISLLIPVEICTAQATVARFISDVSELGPGSVGRQFKVAVVVENVENLYGFDIQLNWTTQWIRYVSHVVTVPAQQYPAPNPPSPYSGILNAPAFKIKDEVDELKNIPGAEPDAMAWFAAASMVPASPFNGNGTVVVFEFQVIDQPFWGNTTIVFHFVQVALGDIYAHPIPVVWIDLEIPLYGREQFNIIIEDVHHAATACYGHSLFIHVLVTNDGQYFQIVDIITYVNDTAVNTTAIELESYESNTTTCEWKTEGYELGNYSISVYAIPIPGESNFTDNTFEAAPVTLKVIGDVDDDLDVDIFDVTQVTSIYGVKKGDPRYNEKCDFDQDSAITIFDVVTCVAYYGTKYP